MSTSIQALFTPALQIKGTLHTAFLQSRGFSGVVHAQDRGAYILSKKDHPPAFKNVYERSDYFPLSQRQAHLEKDS
jgi:hypothetical protein